jgi:Tfp pilus assembly protein PilN
VNPVNLLPAKHRPRTPSGGQRGSAYIVIGVLGALLVMVLFYVLTVNSINSRKDQVAQARAETARTSAQASGLSAYGNFSKVKEERVRSVKELAQGRIDWERFTRGLARVLPADVWLLSANASASGPPSSTAGGSATAAPTTPAPGQTAAPASPEVEVTGCAPGHPEIAVTLVRLRELSGANDVKLNEITAPAPSAGGPTSSASASGTSGGGGQDCGNLHGHPAYKWDATISFEQGLGAKTGPDKVPASLGGGS